MKNKIIILLVICFIGSSFVSCTETDAHEPREASVAMAVQELSAENAPSSFLDLDDVKNIFDKAREMYKTSDAVTLSNNEVITPVNVENIDLAYAQSLDSENKEAVLEAYQTYLSDVSAIAIDMIENIVGDDAVIRPEKNPTTNLIRADVIIALDLEGCDSENVTEVLNKMNNEHPEYQDDIMVVVGSGVMTYNLAEDNVFVLYPSEEELNIEYALKNPTSSNVE